MDKWSCLTDFIDFNKGVLLCSFKFSWRSTQGQPPAASRRRGRGPCQHSSSSRTGQTGDDRIPWRVLTRTRAPCPRTPRT